MIRFTAYITLLGFFLISQGCTDVSTGDFKWDWWNKSSGDQADPDDVSGDFVAPEDVPKDVIPAGDSAATAKDTAANPEEPIIQPMDAASLEIRRHKQDVWGRVIVLRDKEDLPKEQQAVIETNARRDMKDWYAPLEISPPDPKSKDWVDIMVWDFMPEEDFQKQSGKWKDIANKMGVTVPVPITRRGMIPLISDILKLMEEEKER